MGERIQKVVARTGLGSRRQAEQWIEAGDVRINGAAAVPGQPVNANDRVRVRGYLYRVVPERRQRTRWLRYHKPQGRVCTRSDPEGRPTVFDVLPRLPNGRWVALGRLDVNTAGLMLFTDDGALANALTHPSAEIEREYAVRVHGPVDNTTLERLTTGVELDDGPARFTRVTEAGGEGSSRWYHVVLHEGRRNEVRRLWEAVGCQVARLSRVRFGPITLPRRLRRDRFEDLPPAEVESLLATLPADKRPSGGDGLVLTAYQGKRGAAAAKKRASRGRKSSPRRQRS